MTRAQRSDLRHCLCRRQTHVDLTRVGALWHALRDGLAWALTWCALLLAVPQAALAATTCSAYMGQMQINEVRVGVSDTADGRNQVELYNSGAILPAVWQTWSVQIWLKDGAKAAVRQGTYALSGGHTANGNFIWNNTTKYWLQNRNLKYVDIQVLDAGGALVAYLSIGGQVVTVPACYGGVTTVSSSGSLDETGGIMRPTDNTGAWPASLTKTTVHTIGRTNACTAGAAGDLFVALDPDSTKAVQNTTSVTMTIVVFNNSCSTSVAGVKLTTTNTGATYFGSLTTGVSGGSVGTNATTAGHLWNIGTLNAGIKQTLTITGTPSQLGVLTVSAAISSPSSGLVNTADDSDSSTITVQQYNYAAFNASASSATEGTDLAFSVIIDLDVVASKAVTLNYSVSGTADAGDTNLMSTGSVVVPAGLTHTTIDFTITNDSVQEPTKTIIFTITRVNSADTMVRMGTTGLGYILTHTVTLYDDDTPVVDHYELVLPSSSLACLAGGVTVNACADTSSPCTNKSTQISGATATLATSAGALGATSVIFNSSGVASTVLSYTGASNGATARVTLSGPSVNASNSAKCCPDGVGCALRAYCDTTFNTAGFIISASAGGAAATIPSQTAGTASGSYQLRAVKTSTTTQACESALTGSTTVNWALQCNNPTTCATAAPLTLTGNSATAVAGNPNSGVTTSTAVAMTFDANGNAPFSFNYADVGQITLSASKPAGGALLTALGGSSNAFVVKPAGFVLSAIQQTASPFLANPAAASAADAKFVKAGESFSATVTALSSGGAATPNFGRETAPEGVLLTPALALPAGGVAGTLANATVAGGSFVSGVATVTNLAYSEVGIVTLAPSLADGDYLGAGSVGGTTSGNIGRFYPSQFALTTGTPVPACSASFTYFGQDGFTTPFTLSAKNTAGATTQNYAGSFAKLGLSSWSNFGFSSPSLPSGSSLAASATAPSGNWTLGAAAVTALHQISRPTSLAGETSITVKAAPVDLDGVALSATAVGAGTPLRWGRLRLSNAYGSATASLQVPVVAEYWSGNSWVLNSADNCTLLAAGNVVLSNPRNAAGGTSSATSSAGATALATGSGLITLATPTPAGSSLSLDLALNLGSSSTDLSCQASHPASVGAAKPWLRAQNGSCAASADRDPSARASFGLYSPESRKTVHARDIF